MKTTKTLERVDVKFLERPSASISTLVFGMPDTGYVGRLTPYYLMKILKARKIAEVYSQYFPAEIRIGKDGIADLLKGEFFLSTKAEDLLIFTGDSQATTPEGQHMISEKILQVAGELGVKKVFTVGAFITGKIVSSPLVYGTASSAELLEKLQNFGVKTMSEGNITGMNGLLFGLARTNNMESIGLYGETSGIGADPKAAKAVIAVLERMLDIVLDYSAIEKEDGQEIIRSEEDVKPESKEETQKKVREYIT